MPSKGQWPCPKTPRGTTSPFWGGRYCIFTVDGRPARTDIRWSAEAGVFVNQGDGTTFASFQEAQTAAHALGETVKPFFSAGVALMGFEYAGGGGAASAAFGSNKNGQAKPGPAVPFPAASPESDSSEDDAAPMTSLFPDGDDEW